MQWKKPFASVRAPHLQIQIYNKDKDKHRAETVKHNYPASEALDNACPRHPPCTVRWLLIRISAFHHQPASYKMAICTFALIPHLN